MTNKLPAFTFKTLVSASDVLQKFIDRGVKLSPALARTEIRNIAEAMVMKQLQDRADDTLRWEHRIYVEQWGEIDGTEDQETLDAYTEGLDELVERVLLEYEASITQDFLGRVTTDTRLHRPVVRGPDEIELLAAAFAKDAWRVLVHDPDEENETHVLSTKDILAAIGITDDDIKEVLGDMGGPVKTELSPTQELKEMTLRDINEIANEIKEHNPQFDPDEYKQLFDMAIDSDAGISYSGLVSMGQEDDSAAPTLRLFAAKMGAGAADGFIELLNMAPYDDTTDGNALKPDNPDYDLLTGGGSGPDDEEQDPEMREMMGLPPLPVAAAPKPAAPKLPANPASASPKLPGLPGLPKAPGAPPARPVLPKTMTPTRDLSSVIDKKVLQLVRQYVKVKDEDVASALGIARQTYINYADDKKKAVLNASPEQRAYLLQLVEEAMQGLLDARNLLDGNG